MPHKIAVLAASLLAACCIANAAPAALVADDGSSVTLCGSLRKERHWGPPNFGQDPKHDSKFNVWFLVPRSPMVVAYGSEQSAFKQIQLNPRLENAIAARAKGHRFQVVGSLHTAVAPSEVMPVVLWRDSIQEVAACE